MLKHQAIYSIDLMLHGQFLIAYPTSNVMVLPVRVFTNICIVTPEEKKKKKIYIYI